MQRMLILKRSKFILEARDLNSALSDEGLENSYGLEVGKTIQKSIAKGLFGNGLINNIAMNSSCLLMREWVVQHSCAEVTW